MNPQDLTKIKQLIHTAPILFAPERGEWLVLLDLMDERQIKKLEKILGAGSQQSAVSSQFTRQPVSQQTTGQKPMADEKKPAVVPPAYKAILDKLKNPIKAGENSKSIAVLSSVPSSRMPNLSHIMNVPRVGESQSGSRKSEAAGVSPEDLVKKLLKKKDAPLPPKPQNPFAGHLKDMMAEKELTSSQELLELPPPVVPKPKPALPSEASKLPVKPEFLEAVIEEKKPLAVFSKTEVLKPAPVISNIAPQSAPKPLFPLKPSPKIMPTLKFQQSQKAGPAFTPGLNIQRGTVKSTQDTLENIKQHQKAHEQKMMSPATGTNPAIEEKVDLSSLKDLTLLTAKSLEKWDLNAMVSKIKSLISQFGYFDVVFSIEKSEAYKIYIVTGLKMLTAQVDFEQLSLKMEPGEFLERREFEKFTDLLARIQAS